MPLRAMIWRAMSRPVEPLAARTWENCSNVLRTFHCAHIANASAGSIRIIVRSKKKPNGNMAGTLHGNGGLQDGLPGRSPRGRFVGIGRWSMRGDVPGVQDPACPTRAESPIFPSESHLHAR